MLRTDAYGRAILAMNGNVSLGHITLVNGHELPQIAYARREWSWNGVQTSMVACVQCLNKEAEHTNGTKDSQKCGHGKKNLMMGSQEQLVTDA